MDLELTLEQRQQHLRQLLGSEVTFTAPADVPFASDDEDDGKAELFTFHHVREQLFQKDVLKRAEKEAKKFRGKPSVYTPASSGEPNPEKAQQLAMEDYPEFKARKPGDVSKPGETFMLWDLAVKYPLLYIGKTNRIKAAVIFENILEDLVWDFHYLYNPEKLSLTPKLFVPTKQFQRFLEVVNAKVGIELTIPPGQPGHKFSHAFTDRGICPPRYLSRTTKEEDFENLKNIVPLYDYKDACEDAPSFALEELVIKLDVSTLTRHEGKDKKKEKAAKKRKEANEKKQESLRFVQRCLGIQGADECLVNRQGTVLKFDVDQVVPYERFSDVVFAAIDVEVAEQSPSLILEVGISVLDSQHVTSVAPGKHAQNWFPLIKSYHLHTHDYRFQRNHKYVKGCPEAYKFGESEHPKFAQLAKRICGIIENHVKPDSDGASNTISDKNNPYRPLVIVGHDIDSDIDYLASSLGLDLKTLKGFVSFADTKDMHQLWHELPNGRRLGAVLDDLQILHSNLHNAGNDAAYTLQAMLGLAVCIRLDRLHDKAQLKVLREEQCRERTGALEKVVEARKAEYKTAGGGGAGGDPDARELKKRDRATMRPGESKAEWAERYHMERSENW